MPHSQTSACNHRTTATFAVSPTTRCMWTSFFPGNMWIADCDYIRQLLPPSEIASKLDDVATEGFRLNLTGQLKFEEIRELRADYFGLLRYSSEHWVGSHPSICPCDMASTRFRHQTNLLLSSEDYHWSMAPHFRNTPPEELPKGGRFGRGDPMREYFWLPGHLLKWYILYNTAPPENSWVWTWMPGGQAWKEYVQINVREGSSPQSNFVGQWKHYSNKPRRCPGTGRGHLKEIMSSKFDGFV